MPPALHALLSHNRKVPDAHHKNEIVAIFLAILELMKLNQIYTYEENDKILVSLGDNADASAEEILSNISGELNE